MMLRSQYNQLFREALLRRREVENRVGLGRASIYRRIKLGTFPPPVSIGGASVRWKLSDIEAFIASCSDRQNRTTGKGKQSGLNGADKMTTSNHFSGLSYRPQVPEEDPLAVLQPDCAQLAKRRYRR